MENKDLKLNYTQVPNLILDKLLPGLSGSELKILAVIVRKTFGWHKQTDKISRSQFAKLTGLSENSIEAGLGILKKRGLIRNISEPRKLAEWEFNLSISEEQVEFLFRKLPPKSGDTPRNGGSLPPKSGDRSTSNYPQILGTTKEILNKDLNKENIKDKTMKLDENKFNQFEEKMKALPDLELKALIEKYMGGKPGKEKFPPATRIMIFRHFRGLNQTPKARMRAEIFYREWEKAK